MRIILSLSVFACMWLSLVSGSVPLAVDIKLICDEQHIPSVCRLCDEPREEPYYTISLNLVPEDHGNQPLESLISQVMNRVIQRFQTMSILNPTTYFSCSSVRLIRKDSEPDVEDRCMKLWTFPIEDVQDQLKSMQDLVIELKLVSIDPECEVESL